MTDLNELSEFEKNLKQMIEEREKFVPTYFPTRPDGTRMIIPEHGQPYKNEMMTYMAVREHGQPYTSGMVTRMAVREHGQPYDNCSIN